MKLSLGTCIRLPYKQATVGFFSIYLFILIGTNGLNQVYRNGSTTVTIGGSPHRDFKENQERMCIAT